MEFIIAFIEWLSAVYIGIGLGFIIWCGIMDSYIGHTRDLKPKDYMLLFLAWPWYVFF